MNSKGRTSAASAISDPSVFATLWAMRFMFSRLWILHYAQDDKASFG
jgi:hypothetical protein